MCLDGLGYNLYHEVDEAHKIFVGYTLVDGPNMVPCRSSRQQYGNAVRPRNDEMTISMRRIFSLAVEGVGGQHS